MLTISPVSLSQALYTQPQVPSPSSFKILYLEIRNTALGSQKEKKPRDHTQSKAKQGTNLSIITAAANYNQSYFKGIQSTSIHRSLH